MLPEKITNFEKAKLVGYRAEQLQHGYPVFLPEGVEEKWDGVDPVATATREAQLNLFGMQIRRELPNGRVVDVEPTSNLTFTYRHPVEDWMEEESKVHYNRTFPTLVEDMAAAATAPRPLSADFVSRISEFAETEGTAEENTEEAEMADVIAAAESAGIAASTAAVPTRRHAPSTNRDYSSEVAVTITPLKSSFIDAETFYERVPDETAQNKTPTVQKVRHANNVGKKSLITKGSAQRTGDSHGRVLWTGRRPTQVGSEGERALRRGYQLQSMQSRWDNNRRSCPAQLTLCRMDLREPQPEISSSKYDIVSCMFGLNYMNESKGELTACLRNICKATCSTATVILTYVNRDARAFQNTPDCSVTPVSREDWSQGYNFRLGSLVDALEYEVNPSVIDSALTAESFVLVEREAMLPFLEMDGSRHWRPAC